MRGLSKLNSVTRPREDGIEVDVVPGEPSYPDGPRAINGLDAYRSKSPGIP